MSSKFRERSGNGLQFPEGGSNEYLFEAPLTLSIRHGRGNMSSVSSRTILDLNAITFSYDYHKEFIHHLSFSLKEGEFIGLLGANGSGKSTILKLASGILTPFSGLVSVWERPLQSFKNRDRAKLLCYLPQFLDIQIPFRVRDLVRMGLYPYDILPAATIEQVLETVGLSDKADCLITNLSGGEQRRAFIAMTLLQGAGILLLDEPLANLDLKYQIEFLRLLNYLREKSGISIVMALHDINMAFQFRRVILLKEGNIVGMGSPDGVLTEAKLKEAFDIDISVRRDAAGKASIGYEPHFFQETDI